MLAWNQMMNDYNNNVNMSNDIINNLNNLANNMNDNGVLGREIVRILTSMNTTVQSIRNTYENQMNLMRNHLEGRNQELHRQIRDLRDEITRLNNVPVVTAVLTPVYSKEDLCAELLESIESTKEDMNDQTYRILTNKLMEIYHRE